MHVAVSVTHPLTHIHRAAGVCAAAQLQVQQEQEKRSELEGQFEGLRLTYEASAKRVLELQQSGLADRWAGGGDSDSAGGLVPLG